MVFQTRKNRRGAKPKQPGTQPTFANLPDELLLGILQHSDVTDVLRLREASRSFVPACTDAIRAKLKVLYVHPSPSSVQRAIAICESDLSSEVEEICFVSKTFSFRNDHDGSVSPTGPAGYTWPISEPLEEEPETARLGDECTIGTRSTGRCKLVRCKFHFWRTSARDFEWSYRKLLSSLALLKSTSFSLSEVCDKPGFNMIAAQRISSWRKTVEPDTPSKERRAENKLYAARYKLIPRTNFQFADTDALASVFRHHGINFTRLKLTQELAWAGSAVSHIFFDVAYHRALTHIDLTISHGGGPSLWETNYMHLLHSTASTLRELKMGFQYRDPIMVNYDGQGRSERGLVRIVKCLDLPELQHLELRRFPAPDSNFPAEQNAVMVQHINLDTFIVHRCKKLRFLQLTNIIPYRLGHFPPKPWTMKDVVLGLGTAAREIEVLDESTRAWEIDVQHVADDFEPFVADR